MFKFVSRKLLDWYDPEKRDLPWKANKDPYSIWLSEIILQQTRVEQGMPYYLEFISKYPTVESLAQAHQDEVLRLWEGLGYYSRARNLHFAAQQVMSSFNGVFPTKYEDLIKLKGVGRYTAAAVSSFANNEKRAVVDGNVYRFLARLFGIFTPIDSTSGQKEFQELANRLIEETSRSDLYNQAIMDFGATVCKPKNPACGTCIFNMECKAFQEETVNVLPSKSKFINKRVRYFYYLIVDNGLDVLIQKRSQKDIWQNLYEFPLIESHQKLSQAELKKKIQLFFPKFKIESTSPLPKHELTHQTIFAVMVHLSATSIDFKNDEYTLLIEKSKLSQFAFPIVIRNYLNKLYVQY